MRTVNLIIPLLFSMSIWGCQSTNPDREAIETEAILKMHHLQKTYHFENMAEEFAAQLSDDHISVNRGEIKSPSHAEHVERFGNYFSSVKFEKWDDLSPPIIRFSDDYSMAYTIVHKEVLYHYADENGDQQKERTEFSWVAIYKKHLEGWKIDCVASTNKPSQTSQK